MALNKQYIPHSAIFCCRLMFKIYYACLLYMLKRMKWAKNFYYESAAPSMLSMNIFLYSENYDLANKFSLSICPNPH